MNCMKCGRETRGQEVFCDACLDKIAAYPVKPGTPVTIPKRPKPTVSAAPKKPKPEDIIESLEKKLRFQRIASALLAVALGISIGLLGWHYATVEHGGPAIGQNYSTEAPAAVP